VPVPARKTGFGQAQAFRGLFRPGGFFFQKGVAAPSNPKKNLEIGLGLEFLKNF